MVGKKGEFLPSIHLVVDSSFVHKSRYHGNPMDSVQFFDHRPAECRPKKEKEKENKGNILN
jgi:hypothetical protein